MAHWRPRSGHGAAFSRDRAGALSPGQIGAMGLEENAFGESALGLAEGVERGALFLSFRQRTLSAIPGQSWPYPAISGQNRDKTGHLRTGITMGPAPDSRGFVSTPVQLLGRIARPGGICRRKGSYSPGRARASLPRRRSRLIVAMQHELGRSGLGHGARDPSTGAALTVPEQDKPPDALREEFSCRRDRR